MPYTQYEPDATEFFLEFKKQKDRFQKEGISLSFNTILLKAVALALKEAPILNSSFSFDPESHNGAIIENPQINLGVPWLLPEGGMMTLTMFDAGQQSLLEMAKQVEMIRGKVEKTDFPQLFQATALPASSKAWNPGEGLSPQDITGSTVTVSNIGSICRSPRAVQPAGDSAASSIRCGHLRHTGEARGVCQRLWKKRDWHSKGSAPMPGL